MSYPFTHRLLPYNGVDDFLAGTLPFLRDGVAAGDRVLAVTGVGQEILLREALGDDARRVEFVETASWYAHPARTLADCLTKADAAAWNGRRLRVLGEPAWCARPPLEVVEWQRTEALANVAFAETGAAIMCPYAKRSLPAGVLAAARHTHPETVRGVQVLDNPGYVDPWAYSARCDREPLPEPPPDAEGMTIDYPDLYWLRMCVTEYARRTPLPEEDLQRLLVAVTEVVTNATRHGAPPITLRMWTESERSGHTTAPGSVAVLAVHGAGRSPTSDSSLVCEVVDHGEWAPGSGFGYVPPRPAGPGRFGLWAVRLLCSIVQIRTGDGSTTVRLRLRLPGVPADTAVPVNSA
jgi:hypothetical protein